MINWKSSKLWTWVAGIVIAALVVWFLFFRPVSASTQEIVQGDECNQTFDYTKGEDFTDNRVIVDFQDNDNSITVTPKSGYQLVWVQLNVQDDNHNGFFTYTVLSGVKFNPNPGTKIDSAKVEVKKVCATPTPTPTPTPTATPSATPTPFDFARDAVDKCTNLDGVQATIPQGMFLNDKTQCEDIVKTTATPTPAAPTVLPDTGDNSLFVYLALILGLIGIGTAGSIYAGKKLD